MIQKKLSTGTEFKMGVSYRPQNISERQIMASLDRVKVLVLGDSGVGKSSLVHLLCQNQVLGNPSWTVGCSVDVRVQDYKEGTPEEKTYYIELWDVGGSVGSASSIKSTRAVFYNSVNGIILVHDLTNKKSSQNLYRWSLEALNKDSSPTGVIVSNGDYDREQFAENPVPLLLIGTKFDQIPENKRGEVLTRTAFLSEDFNAEEINLDCTNLRYLAAGTSNAVKLSRFFDKVIEKRYFTRDPSQMTGFTDRKRFNFKSLHYD
ncbi:rab-like protein 3 isoform X1 [Syngnathoides biaculeatus]|uniref:rab-like protein 3 isoform X1 n=1 Tax=Syngnathoides biaculeatus TaxID=300417 RepID=UPI002ADE10DC|nr:rab-like protein 3 isoform X1 [Syngnathoides biaculeatus]